jgi:hypothetical protein
MLSVAEGNHSPGRYRIGSIGDHPEDMARAVAHLLHGESVACK